MVVSASKVADLQRVGMLSSLGEFSLFKFILHSNKFTLGGVFPLSPLFTCISMGILFSIYTILSTRGAFRDVTHVYMRKPCTVSVFYLFYADGVILFRFSYAWFLCDQEASR